MGRYVCILGVGKMQHGCGGDGGGDGGGVFFSVECINPYLIYLKSLRYRESIKKFIKNKYKIKCGTKEELELDLCNLCFVDVDIILPDKFQYDKVCVYAGCNDGILSTTINRDMDVFLHTVLCLTLSAVTSNTFPNKLLLSGDIESNPGPSNYQSHRSAIGGFYHTCKRLSAPIIRNFDPYENNRYFPADIETSISTGFELEQKLYSKISELKQCRVRKNNICSSAKIFIFTNTNSSKGFISNNTSPQISSASPKVLLEKQTICHKCQEEGHCASRCRNPWSLKDRSKIKNLDGTNGNSHPNSSKIPYPESHIGPPKLSDIPNTCDTPTTTNDTDPDDLMKAGDINPNPGPTPSPKGRPTKRGFKGTPVKQPMTYASALTGTGNIHNNNALVRSYRQHPVGLLNIGENICFLNSVVQLLYHIPEIRTFIENLSRPTGPSLAVQELFNAIYNSSAPVHSFEYVPALHIPNYNFKCQYDGQEFLNYLLELIYPPPPPPSPGSPIRDEHNIHKLHTLTSRICGTCNNSSDTDSIHNNLILPFHGDVRSVHTIKSLLSKLMTAQYLPNYRCDRCNAYVNASEQTTVTNFKDLVIIQLVIFENVSGINYQQKIFPKINIDETISLYGESLKLHGIVYHHGIHLNSGHFTSAVNINDKWFSINDSLVENGVTLSFHSRNDNVVPYILMYKRSNQTTNIHDLNEPVHFSVDTSIIVTQTNSDTESIMNQSVAGNEISSSSNMAPNVIAKQCEENIKKSFANLCKVVETDCQSQSFDTLSATKKAVVTELFKQTDRIASVQRECSSTDLLKNKKGIKRKSKFASPSKQNQAAKKRMESMRQNLTEEEKIKVNEKDKQRKENIRQNLPEDEKIKVNEKDKQRKENIRQNLPEVEKIKIYEKDTTEDYKTCVEIYLKMKKP